MIWLAGSGSRSEATFRKQRHKAVITVGRWFEHLSDADVGYMIQIAKENWPISPEQQQLRIEWITELYEELYIRWACADTVGHRQGQRL